MGNVDGLHQVAQHADDLGRAVAFYRDVLGLRHIATFEPPGLAFFDLGKTRLLIEQGAPPALLYLRTGDVRGEIERLRGAGVTIETEAHVIFNDASGQFGPAGEDEVMAFIRDSENNLLGIAGRAAPAG